MSELLALLFGAVVISIYARERFNVATFGTQAGLQRLSNLLGPSQMRARSTVRLSFFLYLIMILTAYLGICLYARMLPKSFQGFFGEIGNQFGAIGIAGVSDAAANSTFLPLSVALVFVGIGPSIPIMRNGEEWLRNITHRLVGIPTHVLANAQTLKQSRSDTDIFANLEENREYPLKDSDRDMLTNIANRPERDEDFLYSLRLISAISAWVFEERIVFTNSSEMRNLDALQDGLRKRKLEVFKKVRDRLPRDTAQPLSNTTWAGLHSETEDLSDDIRLYLALLMEYRVEVDLTNSTRHKTVALALKDYLSKIQDIDGNLDAEKIALTTLRRGFWIILTVGVIWGATINSIEQRLSYPRSPELWQDSAWIRSISIGITLLLAYFIPLFVAVSIWFSRSERSSVNAVRVTHVHWSERVSDVTTFIALSWIASCMAMSMFAIFESFFAQTSSSSARDFIGRWINLMEYNAPVSLRGALLAGIMVCFVQRAFNPSRGIFTHKVRFRLSPILAALATGSLMVFVGAATRIFMIWKATSQPNSASLDFLPTDWGVVFYTSLQTGLLGFMLVYLVTSVLPTRSTDANMRKNEAAQ